MSGIADSLVRIADALEELVRETKGKRNLPPTPPIKRKGKDNNHDTRARTRGNPFVKPTVDEVSAYVREKGYTFDPSQFMAYYDANGWKVGRNQMKDWKAACVTWQKRQCEKAKPDGFAKKRADNYIDATAEQKADFIRGMEAAVSREGGFLDGME